MSVVERARIVRVPTEAQLVRALTALLEAPNSPGGLTRGRGSRASRLRLARRSPRRDEPASQPAPIPLPVATPGDPAADPNAGAGENDEPDGVVAANQ
jgi:hypothetical protein